MRIAKVVIVGVLAISLLCIGYIYFFKKDQKEERANFVNKEKNFSEESLHFEKNIDDSHNSSKSKKNDIVAQHPALNMTGEQFDKIMKDGVGIVNCARGGVIDEVALLKALDSGKVAFAGLDVFESEPKPEMAILMHSKISLTPHIGAATGEAQDRIGTELASQIISLLS